MANEVKVEVTNVFRRNQKATAKTVINDGSAGSSKTYSLCQFFTFKRLMVRRHYRLLILRKTQHANRLSVYEEFIGILKKYNIYDENNHNKSYLIYRFPEMDSYVRFAGLEDYQTIKSTGWHDIWIEEANEISKREYLFLLTTRLYRGEKKESEISRVWLSFNPEYCWIKDLEDEKNVEVIRSTWRDNPYANEDYIKTLTGLKDQDEALWQIYSEGMWAQVKNVIYRPYVMQTTWPKEHEFHEIIYGLDFGFNDPTALLKISEKDKVFWLEEKLYQTRLTNSEVITKLQQEIPGDLRYRCIYADCAEPARIKEIYDAGFNIIPAVKGPKSVQDGLDYCKRMEFHTKKENVKLNKEREGYKYKEDKDGNVLDDPVKFKNHLMDGKRYAMYTHYALREKLYEEQYEEEGMSIGVI